MRLALRSYALTGAALAAVMWCSFTWPVMMSAAHVTLEDRFVGVLAVQPAAIVSAVIRFFAWAPSLGIWMFAPEQYSFGTWLAPGLYAAGAMGEYVSE